VAWKLRLLLRHGTGCRKCAGCRDNVDEGLSMRVIHRLDVVVQVFQLLLGGYSGGGLWR
jgi:hypothetical protein